LAYALFMLDRVEEAEEAISEALSLLEHAGWPRSLAAAYSAQLCIEATLGRFDTARTAGEKAARLSEMAGADRLALVVAANPIELAMEVGDNDGATAMGRSLAARRSDSFHSEVRGFALGVLSAALTARDDLDESLAIARDAAPFLRDEGMLFWLFGHLALRAALAGRVKDAGGLCRRHPRDLRPPARADGPPRRGAHHRTPAREFAGTRHRSPRPPGHAAVRRSGAYTRAGGVKANASLRSTEDANAVHQPAHCHLVDDRR
jgi:tetratricopeptide (TPR) repeat protein